MRYQIALRILGWLLSITVHKWEKLNQIESEILLEFVMRAELQTRTTPQPTIFVFSGLQGFEKILIPQRAALRNGATIVSLKEIRTVLKEVGEDVSRARFLTEFIALAIAENNGTVVIDAGFESLIAQASICEKARRAHVRLVPLMPHKQ